ncbi:hypothetical protein Fmac_017832 [Flemingia macrophylla]|uniref:Ferredoxin thioredoxin reductase alpha chain domain-containing protein n=1 Tax=Flemingia macrophylla TaxID=520843 RepID=A0ABD1M3A4_9FABA
MRMECPTPADRPLQGHLFLSQKYSFDLVLVGLQTAVKEDTISRGNNFIHIGARVKVKVPLKVYHVPKIAEVDLTGMEGEIKQYVGLWKGK